jgi:DNA replication protein DnaC
MIEHTLSQLRQLKLNGMASALQIQLEQPGAYEDLAFAERLQLLVDHEDQERNQRKQERLTSAAQFKLKAPMPKTFIIRLPEACNSRK